MLENSRVIVDTDSCTKCKACSDECNYYYFESDELHFEEAMEEFCIGCGKCVAVCPVSAIKLKSFEEKVLENVPVKADLPSFEVLGKLFKSRRSRRQFTDKSIPRELIEKLLNVAGRYSPTAKNQEDVHYTIVQNREILQKLSEECTKQVTNLIKTFEDPQGRKALEAAFPQATIRNIENVLPSFKRALKRINAGLEVWRWDAEIIIIHSPEDSFNSIENCTLAACHIMLAAETLGLGTCSLGYITAFFNQFRQVGKIVKLPLKHKVGYTLAIGYPKAKYFRIPERKPLKAKWL